MQEKHRHDKYLKKNLMMAMRLMKKSSYTDRHV